MSDESGGGQGAYHARATAARLVARWLESGDFPDRLLDDVSADRPFVMEVIYGVAKWRRLLDWVAGRYVKRDPEPPLYAHLLVGLYQLFRMSSVAEHAAVNETVEAAKHGPAHAGAGFLNAVLRRALRERAAIEARIPALPLAVRESHPDVLVERWAGRAGADGARRLCEWNNGRPDVVIRLNTARVSAAEYGERLAAGGVLATPHPFRPESCLSLPRGARVADLPGYADGLFAVQDPSTLVSVEQLAPKPGERVLDACAAPGGKTAMIAERMAGEGRLVAADVYPDRLDVLRTNLQRMRAGFAEIIQADLAGRKAPVGWSGGEFDAVLLDVPCSNTGVLRRRPDARWRFTLDRLANLMNLQRALLSAGAGLVRPGGRLVYSTCSIEPDENESLVGAWLRANPAFTCVSEVRLFPPDTATDGAYAALLSRRG